MTCECGAGIQQGADGLTIQPHDIDCAQLRAGIERERHGYCMSCNAQLTTERKGEITYCPNGCSQKLTGESALEALDAVGSGWIRDELKK
jgi:hypothetical protein